MLLFLIFLIGRFWVGLFDYMLSTFCLIVLIKSIDLFGDVGVVMRYPTIQTISKLENMKADTIDDIFDIVVNCIDFIYQGDEVFYAKEQTKEELLEFLNNLTSEQFKKIQKFFETMPRLKQEVDYNCPVCGKAHHQVLEGLQSFF